MTVSPSFADEVRQVLTDTLNLPQPFVDYMVQYQALNGLSIPVSQLTGFAAFTTNSAAEVGAGSFESTASGTYTDLPSVGPTLTNLTNGYYVVIVSCGLTVVSNGFAGGARALMSPSVNSGTPADTDAAYNEGQSIVKSVGFSTQKLSNGTNTLTAKYRVSTGSGWTAQFTDRRMFALKYANI